MCASFLKRAFLLPAPVVLCERVCVCVVQFEGHPVRDCNAALSHPHTSLPFYLTVHLSTYLPQETFPAINKLKYANLYLYVNLE